MYLAAAAGYGHRPPEVAAFALRLRDRLQADGITELSHAFSAAKLDEMAPTGIEAGTEWREKIGAGIRAARAVLFVASPHSVASDWSILMAVGFN
eukprot:tig00000190_g13843.t1